MIIQPKLAPIELLNGSTRFTFTESGDAFCWMHGPIMINSYRGSSLHGSPNNIYLRIPDGDGLRAYPLLGIASDSVLKISREELSYEGYIPGTDNKHGICYRVTLRLTPYGIWFFDISLRGSCNKMDVLYTQDIGVATPGCVSTNELYAAQYLGHYIGENENGYVVCSRQNMSQEGCFPYLQQGSLGIRIRRFSTDGTQFYGLSYKKTHIPQALSGDLENCNRQLELSQISLQTESFTLNGNREFSFYGICKTDHPSAVTSIAFRDELLQAFSWKASVTCTPRHMEAALAGAEAPAPEDTDPYSTAATAGADAILTVTKPCIGEPYAAVSWDLDSWNAFYPRRILEEQDNGRLLSFFTPDNSHVVTQEKELLTMRPHGHILMTGFSLDRIPSGVVSTTNYMSGEFNSQLVVGNTTYHKLLSNHRGLLNVVKNSGQRIYVKIDGAFRQLTLPSAYEMDISGSTWHYQIGEDVLTIHCYTVFDRPEVILTAYSHRNIAYDFIITNQITAGANEFEQEFLLEKDGGTLTIQSSRNAFNDRYYPGLAFRMRLPEACRVSDDRVFFPDARPRDTTLLTLSLDAKSAFSLTIQASESGDFPFFTDECDREENMKRYHAHYRHILRDFSLEIPSGRELSQKLNATMLWYAHDALIHFASPHGLEQSGGAAWGTRDICQGPVEFFLALHHTEIVRDILLRIFSHQLSEGYEWPQWFMFDAYPIHQAEHHGDVVFWPLKTLGDYLAATDDFSILDEILDYRMDDGSCAHREETLFTHVARAVEAVKDRFLPGTALISYAGGDWDDTLQPASSQLKEKLSSAWTQALAVQTFETLSLATACHNAAFAAATKELAERISEAFTQYFIRDGVIAGFYYHSPEEGSRYLLHPDDDVTSIHYRLLPMTRSILAQLADPEQAQRSNTLIDAHLSCPDGVRLMDRPAGYEGGISKIFLRAEQAANVGREISLQYVHAHIRYIEALATMGLAEKAWHSLLVINPILIRDYVPNALPRQSNVYFSSSDGCYNDRYDYAAGFHRLREGEISVMGGWRLYSSGPGIYIARVITNLLGLRYTAEGVILDPVLPENMDGLSFNTSLWECPVTIYYHMLSDYESVRIVVDDKEITADTMHNRYRKSGILLGKKAFLDVTGNKADTESCHKMHIYT